MSWGEYGIDIPTHIEPSVSGELYLPCPECSKTRKKKNAKCLSVNTQKEVWCCNHCGWSGGLAKGVEYRSGQSNHYRKPVYRKPEGFESSSMVPEKLLSWFEKRGITEDVLLRNQIVTTDRWMPQVEDRVRVIAFPYFKSGELVNVKYRDHHKNFVQEPNAEKTLYKFDDVVGREVVFVVEGEIDALSCEVAGFPNTCSVPDGAPAINAKQYEQKFSYLDSAREIFEQARVVVLAVDNDEPGRKLESELARRIGKEKCSRVSWPDGCKDANEVLVRMGAAALKECLKSAKPYPVEGIHEVGDLAEDVVKLYKYGYEPTFSTGWSKLDKFWTVRPGELTIVTGIPSHGKSTWLDALVVNLAMEHEWPIGFFSPENWPMHYHFSQLAEKCAEKPFSEGPTERMSEADLQGVLFWAQEKFQFIMPDEHPTPAALLALAKTAVYRYGVKFFVFDPWNEMEHIPEQGETETQYTSRILSEFRWFARKHEVHVALVAHPTKLQKDKKTDEYPVPTLYDVSGSANWRNKADNGIAIYRDVTDTSKPTQVHIQKVRFKWVGAPGVVELHHHRPTGRYTDLDYEAQKWNGQWKN